MALSVRSWVANEGGKHLVLVLWLGANTLLFMRTFLLYYCGQQYHYLHQMLGVTSRKARRLLDKSKTFHVACGVAICVFSVVHVSAHLVNVVNFSVRYSEDFPSLNVARYRGEDPRLIILTTVPGITGILLVLILFLMFTASSYCIRVSNYEIFWYTHNLFIVFYIILIVHVVGGALKYQTNFEAHPPGCLRANQTNPEESGQAEGDGWSCREEARFQPNSPETWLWVSGPLCLYCAERLYRYIRSNSPVTIVAVVRHPCDVIELRMLKKDFKAYPGQYIVLNCPSVSSFENHPFTLTACPTEKKETLGIHLRVVGDWTERFTELLLPDPGAESEILPMVQQRRYPKLYVDGPFGSSSQEVFNYEVSLCVAGGIGVTPFACVLHALLDGWRHFRLRRLYFVWVCRELQSFYWFAELLCALHHKLWQENRPDYLNLQLFVSQTDGLQNISEERYRPLSSRMMIGRPRWKLLFEEIGRTNKHKRVGVFCCGPKGISRTLHRLCNSDRYSGTTFEFNKESFS
ncbi:NADPH oxidase 4 isoform X3 [Salmo salar]|uniref:NADPH oxidase 4 isoform X3 n=1 Tax=Salmo salar TaxID=8030 RepID=A0A1S3NUM3_SALSA|nr:NADPH oxidase 4 isoform X3 [Salmo salar]